ncbi:MAG: hypothetical protein JXN61_07960 [Sedimentisphaerales bacterium]|nr:hypothetical protein [Sedimentisphaerales bacterium]
MPDRSDSFEPCVVFTPLPGLSIKGNISQDAMAPLLKDGLTFTNLDPTLRRSLLEVAKSAEASDDVLSLILESELIFWASVPRPLPSELAKWPIGGRASLYSYVAQKIFDRIYNVLMIFSAPASRLGNCCWFFAKGTYDQIDGESIGIVWPAWVNDPPRCYIGITSESTIKLRAPKLTINFDALTLLWPMLGPLLLIDKLNSVFKDPAKQRGYHKAAEDYAKRKAEKFAKIRADETGTPTESRVEGDFYDKWWEEGYARACAMQLQDLDINLQERSKGGRLICAMQFFWDAPTLPFPYRFLAAITCLESIFSNEHKSVTFQIAARTASFLEPNDASKRAEVYNTVVSLYNLRSKIVHGRTFNILKKVDPIMEAEVLVRFVLMRLIADDSILQLILGKDRKPYEDYLSRLAPVETDAGESEREP